MSSLPHQCCSLHNARPPDEGLLFAAQHVFKVRVVLQLSFLGGRQEVEKNLEVSDGREKKVILYYIS